MKKFLINAKAKIARDISKMIAFYYRKEQIYDNNWTIYSEDENEATYRLIELETEDEDKVMELMEKLCKFVASEDIYYGQSTYYYGEEA